MTPEEADYKEALRRIQEAKRKRTGATKLHLQRLKNLTRLPPKLNWLRALQSLDLSECRRLSGTLAPLARLTSLRSLNLAQCWQLSGDLSPLVSLRTKTEGERSGFFSRSLVEKRVVHQLR